MATMKFILRKSRSKEPIETGKLCARIIHNRKTKVATLPITLHFTEWDEKKQRIINNDEDSPRYRYLNRATDTITNYAEQFQETVDDLEKQGRYDISDIIGGYSKRKGISDLYNFASQLADDLEKTKQGRTARAYLTACRALISFNKGNDIPLKHINNRMMKEFEAYLKERGAAMNTVSYYMRMLRAIYRKAIKERIIDAKRVSPFEGTFTGFQETRKRALDVDQLSKLNNLDFSSVTDFKEAKSIETNIDQLEKGLYDCWRFFFFCFHARGMSFVDMAYLRKENIRHGVISYYRKKTKQKIEITVTQILQNIINSFDQEVKYSPYLFPIIKDENKPTRIQYENGLRTQNRRLKRLAKLARLESKTGLTTHVSRHSWATIGKLQNLPLAVISEGLGHSSEKMTYTYLASFDRTTLDKANEKIAEAINNPSNINNNKFIPT